MRVGDDRAVLVEQADARAGLAATGLEALPALAPRITNLRALEAEVEQATDAMQSKLDDTYGDPGAPAR